MSYYYLIASLPVLKLGEAPPFDRAEFLQRCEQEVTAGELELLEKLTLNPETALACGPAGESWAGFETNLRNWTVRRRTHKTEFAPENYLKADLALFANMEKIVDDAFDSANPKQIELGLDQARWQFLDALTSGHQFDFTILVIYYLQLQLLEKWSELSEEVGQNILDQSVQQVLDSYEPSEAS